MMYLFADMRFFNGQSLIISGTCYIVGPEMKEVQLGTHEKDIFIVFLKVTFSII